MENLKKEKERSFRYYKPVGIKIGDLKVLLWLQSHISATALEILERVSQ
jgi:hypothetical protein